MYIYLDMRQTSTPFFWFSCVEFMFRGWGTHWYTRGKRNMFVSWIYSCIHLYKKIITIFLVIFFLQFQDIYPISFSSLFFLHTCTSYLQKFRLWKYKWNMFFANCCYAVKICWRNWGINNYQFTSIKKSC